MKHTYRYLLLAIVPLVFSPFYSQAQGCNDPAPLCFEQFDNIQSDSTDIPDGLMLNFACGEAFNGTLYEITTLSAGELIVSIANSDCELNVTNQGDTLKMVVFSSNTPDDPCDEFQVNLIQCFTFGQGGGDSFSIPILAAGETYFIALFGDMNVGETSPAICDYDIQIAGSAVEFFMSVPDSPIITLEGSEVQIEGVEGVDEYLWTGPGIISDSTLANPTINAGVAGSYDYELTGTVGDCVVTEIITIVVSPNIVPTDIITPNGDGVNDSWYIQSLDQRFENAEIKIFDRWGQVVFKSIGYGPDREWDGTNNGNRLPIGAYFYIIELNIDGLDTEPFLGDISIIY